MSSRTLPGVGLSATLSLALLLPCSCSSLPRPPTGKVPPDAEQTEVPYPPPPARVETIPAKHGDRDVWVDGQWEWDGKAWNWRAGAWVTPPARAYFTPWTAARREDGRLFYTRASWRTRDGRALDQDAIGGVCPAAPSR